MKQNISASGIIVFRNKNNYPEILGLVALPKHRKRSKGRYDLPKGRIDEGETPLQAARRECYEESGLEPKIININNPVINGPLCLWLGEVRPDDDVVLTANPHTGEYEHEGYEWLTIKKMKKNCLNYIRPFIIEVEKDIWEHFKIWRK